MLPRALTLLSIMYNTQTAGTEVYDTIRLSGAGDTGILRVLRPTTVGAEPQQLEGPLLECLVVIVTANQ